MDTSFDLILETPPRESLEGTLTNQEKLPLDEVMINLAQMLSVGKTTSEIALALDRSVNWVRTHKRDEDVISLVNLLHKEAVESARSVIIGNTEKAASTIVTMMDLGPPSVRLAAAKDLLDRLGMKAPDKKQIETTVNVNNNTREERIAQIRAKAYRLGLAVGEGGIVDVDYE